MKIYRLILSIDGNDIAWTKCADNIGDALRKCRHDTDLIRLKTGVVAISIELLNGSGPVKLFDGIGII